MNSIANRKQKAALLVVGLAIFLDMLIYGLVVPILPSYAASLGANQSEIGLLFGSYAVALFLATPIFGALSDRIGRRGPLLWGLLGLSAATLLFAFAEQYWLLVAARTLQGLAAAITWTAGFALLADLYPSEERGKAMGIVLSGQAAGILLGPTVGGWLYELGGYHLPFVLAAGLTLVDGILRLVLLRDLPVHTPDRSKSPFRLLRDRGLLIIGGVVVIGAVVPSVLEPTLPLHLQQQFQASPGVIGLLFAIPTIAYGAVAPVIGKLSAQFGRRTIWAGLLMVAVSLPLTTLAPSLWLQSAALALLGVSMGVVLAASLPELSNIADRSGSASYGITFAIYNTAYSLGMMLGPIGGSVLADYIGLTLSYVVLGGVTVLYMVIAILASSNASTLERDSMASRNMEP